MPLRIEVHHQNAISPSAEFGRQIDGDRRLACSAFSVGNRQNACPHLDSSPGLSPLPAQASANWVDNQTHRASVTLLTHDLRCSVNAGFGFVSATMDVIQKQRLVTK